MCRAFQELKSLFFQAPARLAPLVMRTLTSALIIVLNVWEDNSPDRLALLLAKLAPSERMLLIRTLGRSIARPALQEQLATALLTVAQFRYKQ